MACGRFVIDGGSRLDLDLIARNLEEAGGVRSQGVAERIGRIRIDGAQRRYGCPGRRVLVDRPTSERDVGRRLVIEIVDGEGNDLRIDIAGAVIDFDGHVVACGGLVIDRSTGLDLDLIARDLEEAGRIRRDRVAE